MGLYANDMLLYLTDSDHSLQTALQIIENFGRFSGLTINWDKSQILPIDIFPPTREQTCLPLVGVSTLKHLGIQVSRSLADFIPLNVEPLIPFIKSKIQTWARLPVGVAGRVGLIKMILLPKILYVLWHFPVYIPFKYFKIMDTLLQSFGGQAGTNSHGRLYNARRHWGGLRSQILGSTT